MTAQQHAIAGWYKDPSGVAHTLRWWNGTAWTIVTATRKALFTPAHQGVPTITPQRGAGGHPQAAPAQPSQTQPSQTQVDAAIPPPPGGWQHGPTSFFGGTRIYGETHHPHHQPQPQASGAAPYPPSQSLGGYQAASAPHAHQAHQAHQAQYAQYAQYAHQAPPAYAAAAQTSPPASPIPPTSQQQAGYHNQSQPDGGGVRSQREAHATNGFTSPLAPPSWDPTTAQKYAGAEQFHAVPVAAMATQPPPQYGNDGQPWWYIRETRWTASGEDQALKELRRQNVTVDPVGQRHNLNAAAVTDLWQPRWLDDGTSDHRDGRQRAVRDAWPNMPSLKTDWFWAFAVAIYALVGVVTAGFLGHGPLGQTLSPLIETWR